MLLIPQESRQFEEASIRIVRGAAVKRGGDCDSSTPGFHHIMSSLRLLKHTRLVYNIDRYYLFEMF